MRQWDSNPSIMSARYSLRYLRMETTQLSLRQFQEDIGNTFILGLIILSRPLIRKLKHLMLRITISKFKDVFPVTSRKMITRSNIIS